MSGGNDVTDTELAGLSEEERAALALDDDDKAALEEIAGDADDASETDDDDEQPEKAAPKANADDVVIDPTDESGGEPTKAAPKADDAAGKQPAAAAATDDDDEPFVARYVAPPVEDYDDQVKALREQRAQVLADFKSGAIEGDAMDEKIEEIESQRRDLDAQKQKAEISAEMAEQTSRQQWLYEVNRFVRNVAKTDGIDYKNDAILNAAFDTAVKSLANDEKNADKGADWFLEQAHAQIKARFRLAPAANNGDGKTKVPSRKPDLRDTSKTLASVPAAGADDASAGDDGFKHIDELEGIEKEMAVARMSPAEQERWLKSA